MLGKVSPEVQLDRCVGRDQVNCTDCQRTDVAIPGVPLAEQVEAGSCDLCVALGGECQLSLVLSMGQCVVPDADLHPGGSQIAFAEFQPDFLRKLHKNMPDLVLRKKILIAGDPMPNALDWGIIIAGHDPRGIQAIGIDPKFLTVDS